MNICLVTPDLVGPVLNGGIGTHAYHLCNLLREHELTVLFTSEPEANAAPDWQDLYRQMGIRVLTMSDLPEGDEKTPEEWFFARSRRIGEYLQSEHFDLVHFQEWHANGFFAIRARRTGVALQSTRLVVTMHSPNAWSREGMQTWPEPVFEAMKQDFAERYCCENADILLAPSTHMFDWAEARGWQLPEDRRVLPCASTAAPAEARPAEPDPAHIIFFGRLETRKGLGIFIDGLKLRQAREGLGGIRKVTFLGKPGHHNGRAAEALLDELAAALPGLEISRELSRDTHGALDFLEKSGGVAFIPSLLDNCPYTVIECIERGIPFMAARVGGIPEMVDSRCLFAPDREGVAGALGLVGQLNGTLDHPYTAASANHGWAAFHESLPALPKADDGVRPRVSICVPYYNYPRYLPQLLASIAALEYADFEVIICNDGSSQAEAQRVFAEMAQHYAPRGWTFFEQANAGVGAARNAAAARASGDYLVFMDADKLARREMLEVMVRAMRCSHADALTCYFAAFSSEEAPAAEARFDYHYRPIGATFPLSILENTIGDANCIVRRSAFEAIGGFTAERNASFEDWELLLQLAYRGYRLDVIPQELFFYRHLEEGFSRITNHYRNHMRAVQGILADCPPMQRALITDFALPVYYQFLQMERHYGKMRRHHRAPLHKLIYRWYRRKRNDPRYL